MKLPQMTKEPLMYVDMTPDDDLPLRILKAYRENCDCKWATDLVGNCDNSILQVMNEHAEQRAKILDKAIVLLEKGGINVLLSKASMVG